jgi:nucleotide-binding universal stress UspA family protein/uncharacterized protein (DUF2267 family)
MLPIRTILHPTDFSDCSRHAGEFAVNLAKDYRARLVLVHVVEPPIYSSEVALALPDPTSLRATAEAALSDLARSYSGQFCDKVVAIGFAATEIIRVAAETRSDLIVMGTHGRTGLGRLVMGSVAEEVIRRAPCPVLALKPTDTRPTDGEFEDWISAAMATPRHARDRADEAARLESVSRAANASFAATVEHTVRTSNHWLRDVRLRMGEGHANQAFRVLRAVLHVLRDHLTVGHVASLGAQLPLLLRGILYEGWDPSRKLAKERHKADFVEQVRAQIAPEPLEQPERAIRGVFAALSKHLTAGEVAKLRRALPHEIRELWNVQRTQPIAAK